MAATEERNEVATLERRERPGLIETFAERQNLKVENVMPVLMDTIIPNGKASNEQVQVFLAVCNEYKLNPFLKEIYAFPAKGGGIQPIVSIDGWLKLIHERKDLDGVEFEEISDEEGIPEHTTCIIYRKGMGKPVRITEYFAECNRETEPWRKWPRRMLRHKALIQCARVAFGFAGIVDEDEAERMKEVGAIVVETERSETAKRVDEKLSRRRSRDIAQPEPEEAETEPEAPEAEPKEEAQPEAESAALHDDPYEALYALCGEHQAIVDAALEHVELPPMDRIVPQDLTVAQRNRIKRALKNVQNIISQ